MRLGLVDSAVHDVIQDVGSFCLPVPTFLGWHSSHGCKMPSRSKMAVHTSLFVSKRRDEDTSPSDLKYSFFPSVLLGPNAMSQLAYTNHLGQTIGYSFIRCKDAFGYFLFILLTIRDTISYCLYLISLLIYCTSVSLEVVEFVTSS